MIFKLIRLVFIGFLNFFILNILSAETNTELIALRGNTDAQIQMALFSFNKSPRDLQASKMWLEMAVMRNHPKACHMLGVHYQQGWGTPKNLSKAIKSWKRGAQLGNLKCIEKIVITYFERKEIITAYAWVDVLSSIHPSLSIPKKWTSKEDLDEFDLSQIDKTKKLILESLNQVTGTQIYDPIDKSSSVIKISLPNGDKFEGNQINFVPNGFGLITRNNGTTFMGEFVNGVPNGFGTLISTKGVITYQGIWREGKPASIYKKVSNEQRSR